MAYLYGKVSPTPQPAFMEIVYPVFSVFALLSLHLCMYGCNLFMWRRTTIDSNSIFEFSPTTALKHRDTFIISFTLMTAVVGTMVIHLFLRAAFSPIQVDDIIPGILLLIFIILLFCPLDIFYRPTRHYFICVLRNIICSPFYKVLLVDSFMGDQLTSQILLLRNLETIGCNFFARIFKTHHPQTCYYGRHYIQFTYIISFMPYYWRAMQCARKVFQDRDGTHLANMGKYVCAILTVWARIAYDRQDNHLRFTIALSFSMATVLYLLYWDFVKDWGFLNRNSRNPWLRDALTLKYKSVYYISMAFNVVLRVTWVVTFMHLDVGPIKSRWLDFLLASLEVIRRGQWNFYRLEHEHLTNLNGSIQISLEHEHLTD